MTTTESQRVIPAPDRQMKSLCTLVRTNPYVRALIVLCAACSSSASSAPVVQQRAPVMLETEKDPAMVASQIGHPQISGSVISVRIVVTNSSDVASDEPTYARAGDPVTLYAVIELADHTVFSDAPKLRL